MLQQDSIGIHITSANPLFSVSMLRVPLLLLHRLPHVPLVSYLLPPSHYILPQRNLALTHLPHPFRLLNYTPQATLVRLLTINSVNAYITSWVLYLSGGSEDPRLLLPAWISIASVRDPTPPHPPPCLQSSKPSPALLPPSTSTSTSSNPSVEDTHRLTPSQTLTFLYHLTHPRLAILKETSLSISVFSIASFISMVSLLLQLHLTRANDPPVPLFMIAKQLWEWIKVGVGWFEAVARVGKEL